jgi:hypothetical protein
MEQASIDELARRIGAALEASPAADVARNLRALLISFLDATDVVLREDFDMQRELLERAQGRITQLEARVAELEAAQAAGNRRR